MTISKDSLTKQLLDISETFHNKTDKEIHGLDIDLKEEFEKAENIIKENEKEANEKRSAIIAPFFGGKKISSHSGYDMTVFCKSQQEADNAIETAKKIGYRNISTYVPKISDGTPLGSIDNPYYKFAVEILHNEERIIGFTGYMFIEMLKRITDSFQEHIVHTYAHDNIVAFTLRNKDVAEKLENKLSLNTDKLLEDNDIKTKFKIKNKKERLDSYIVYLQIK